MSRLLLINGKFVKNGKTVPATFGDKEQIALMEAYERLVKGVEPWACEEDDEIVGWSIDCLCGNEITFEEKEDMDGWSKICKCGLRYICHADEDNFLTIKLKPRKL